MAPSRGSILASRVTVIIETALPKEFAAVRAMLDDAVEFQFPGRGAARAFVLGEVPAKGGGTHAVAAYLGDQGNTTAGARAALAMERFPTTEVVVMVGIAGGVPSPLKAETHVRLGDIVVSGEQGVVKYDFVKKDSLGAKPRHPPRPPDPQLLEAALRLDAGALEGRRPWEEYIERARSLPNSARPDAERDLLADTANAELTVPHPFDDRRTPNAPRVFMGTIACADTLLKDPATRDALREQHDVRAVEMEGFGIAEATWLSTKGFIVVRGICDYCDSRKNDVWQGYAAIAAAAYARALLQELAPLTPNLENAEPSKRFFTEQPERDDVTGHAPPVDRVQATPVVAIVAGAAMVEGEHQAALDRIRELIATKGQPALALEEVEALRVRVWAGAGGPVRARIVALRGYAKIDLGQVEGGARDLVDALNWNPSDAKVQANAAYGHALLGNTSAAREWSQRALALDPMNTTALQVAVQFDERPDDAVREFYERLIGKSPELLCALAQRASEAGDRERAIRLLDEASSLDPTSDDVAAALGRAILDNLASRPGFPAWIAPDDRSEIARARELLLRAWCGLSNDDLRRGRLPWLFALVNVKRALDDTDAAQYADEALKLTNREADALRLRAAIAADSKEFDVVIRLIESIAERGSDDLGVLASAYASVGRLDEAIAAFRELLKADDLAAEVREQAQRNLLLSLLEAKRFDDARAEMDAMASLAPDNIATLLLGSEVYERLGERGTRDALLERALGSARRGMNPQHLLRLGDMLMRADRPSDAAEIYSLVIVPQRDDRYARRYVEALYRAGRFESALGACQQITATSGKTRFCTEMVSVIHEQLGNLPAARAVCEDYIAECGPEPTLSVRLALILFRAGDMNRLRDLLASLEPASVAATPRLAATLSYLLAEVGRPSDALNVLFEMRRKNLADASAHLTYISRASALARDLPKPTVVGPDVAVHVTGVGAPGWIIISSSPDAMIDLGEFPVDHVLSRALLGKKVGDEITFEKARDRKWNVAEIDLPHGVAFRQSLKVFPAHFPDDGRLEQHDVPEDMDEFVEALRKRLLEMEPRTTTLLSAYAEGRLTLGALADALGRSMPETIGVAAASPHGLIATSNTRDEKHAASEALKDPQAILLADFTSIFLLHELGLLSDVAKWRKIVVAQSTLDAFREEELRWKSMPKDEHMSLGIRDGQLVRHVMSKEDVERQRISLRTLISTLEQQAASEGVEPSVAEAHAAHRDIGPLIGESFWHTILLSSSKGRALLSDDLLLRKLAAGTTGVRGTCTAHVLWTMAREGALPPEKYSEAIVKLFASGYRFIATDAQVLLAAARIEAWRPQGVFRRLADTLKGPDGELSSSVRVAAEFLRLLWFGVVLPDQRNALAIVVLDALVAGRATSDVVKLLHANVARAFALIPIGESEMHRLIEAWKASRIRGR